MTCRLFGVVLFSMINKPMKRIADASHNDKCDANHESEEHAYEEHRHDANGGAQYDNRGERPTDMSTCPHGIARIVVIARHGFA